MVKEQACQWALTGKRTLWGGGALQTHDLCLLQDGSKRGNALVIKIVASETAKRGVG